MHRARGKETASFGEKRFGEDFLRPLLESKFPGVQAPLLRRRYCLNPASAASASQALQQVKLALA
jgi:hypothetical protein